MTLFILFKCFGARIRIPFMSLVLMLYKVPKKAKDLSNSRDICYNPQLAKRSHFQEFENFLRVSLKKQAVGGDTFDKGA